MMKTSCICFFHTLCPTLRHKLCKFVRYKVQSKSSMRGWNLVLCFPPKPFTQSTSTFVLSTFVLRTFVLSTFVLSKYFRIKHINLQYTKPLTMNYNTAYDVEYMYRIVEWLRSNIYIVGLLPFHLAFGHGTIWKRPNGSSIYLALSLPILT